MPQYRSVSLGVWVKTGSVRETAAESGASHFIEHMLFKGTSTRSASDIAAQMDSIGGTINAFTSKECTCFYAKVLDEHAAFAANLLADLLMNSRFDPEDIRKEQGVVCEEILMMEDSPEDLAHETMSDLYYQGDPLARPILGTQDSVNSFTQESLFEYMRRCYGPENIVIACAGSLREAEMTAILEDAFCSHSGGGALAPVISSAPGGIRFRAVEKDVEQVHICLGMPGYAIDEPNQYPLFVLNNALGGSMSSRLFQTIREERGLAYSVYSYPMSYVTTGCFALYAGTGERQAKQVIELMLEELDKVRGNGLTQEEFLRSKQQLKGNFLLGQESTSGRMNALGKSELLLGRVYSEEERVEQIEGIQMEDVLAILPHVFKKDNLCLAVVGRTAQKAEELRSLIL